MIVLNNPPAAAAGVNNTTGATADTDVTVPTAATASASAESLNTAPHPPHASETSNPSGQSNAERSHATTPTTATPSRNNTPRATAAVAAAAIASGFAKTASASAKTSESAPDDDGIPGLKHDGEDSESEDDDSSVGSSVLAGDLEEEDQLFDVEEDYNEGENGNVEGADVQDGYEEFAGAAQENPRRLKAAKHKKTFTKLKRQSKKNPKVTIEQASEELCQYITDAASKPCVNVRHKVKKCRCLSILASHPEYLLLIIGHKLWSK